LKKRGGVRHNWLVRRFVLGNGTLQYYDKQSFKGSVPTMFISEVRKTFPDMGGKSDRKMPFRFEFYAKAPSEKTGRTYFLSAASELEQDEWITAIKSWVGYVDDATRKAASGGTREVANSPRGEAAEDEGEGEGEGDEKAAATAAGDTGAAKSNATGSPATAATTASTTTASTPSVPAVPTTPPVASSDSTSTNASPAGASSTEPATTEAALSVRQEVVPNADGSIRIVCEGGDAAAVALAAQEAVAAYAATHAAIQFDPGFVETGRTVEKHETEDGFDEVTTVTASDGMGTIKTYCNTVSIRNKPS